MNPQKNTMSVIAQIASSDFLAPTYDYCDATNVMSIQYVFFNQSNHAEKGGIGYAPKSCLCP